MLYELFDWLNELGVPGAGIFQYISFRAAISVITALVLSTLIGKRVINFLQKKREESRARMLRLQTCELEFLQKKAKRIRFTRSTKVKLQCLLILTFLKSVTTTIT